MSKWGKEKKMKISVMPTSGEKIRQLKLSKHFVFRDSLEHLSGTLDRVSKDILGANHPLKILKTALKREYSNVNEANFELIRGKLPFPYELLGEKKLEFPLNKLEEKHFNNLLNNTEGTREQVEQVRKIGEKFKIKTLKELTKLYCQVNNISKIFKKIFKIFSNHQKYLEIPLIAG